MEQEKNQKFRYKKDFPLESGGYLPGIDIAYHTYGRMNREKNNVIWVCHALTANSDVFDWWKGLFGEDELFNPRDFFIVCANKIGSCYGSTGPLSINPETGNPWYHNFPLITVRDIVRSYEILREHLGIESIYLLIGGSTGGQQVLEWAFMNPGVHKNIAPVATHARSSPWSIAFNQSQRLAVEADSTWKESNPEAGLAGMLAARSIALLSYRNYNTYMATQSDDAADKLGDYRAMSYQRYQGEKLVRRFNAFSYMSLLNTMDTHNLGRGRGGVEKALSGIKARTMVTSIKNDLLFPEKEQILLADLIPGAEFVCIDSLYGHDGFLIETKALSREVGRFLGLKVRVYV